MTIMCKMLTKYWHYCPFSRECTLWWRWEYAVTGPCDVVLLRQGLVSGTSSGVFPASSDMEFPTLQFVESVKSFVNKCQVMCISAEEYRLMKLIALFQSAGLSLCQCLFLI